MFAQILVALELAALVSLRSGYSFVLDAFLSSVAAGYSRMAMRVVRSGGRKVITHLTTLVCLCSAPQRMGCRLILKFTRRMQNFTDAT